MMVGTGTLQLPPHPCLSAKSSLEIYTDENGVPHVVGDNVSDVMFGQGKRLDVLPFMQ